MPAPYNDLNSKLEAALAAEISALTLSGTRGSESVDVAVRTGLDDDELLVPRVTCQCNDTAEEAVRGTGIFRLRAAVHVHSHSSDETLAVHRERVATVIDAIMQSDIASQLTANVSDFHCYDVNFDGHEQGTEGNLMHTVLNVEAVCCGSDLV